MRLVDAHCHLEDEAFDQDREEVIRRALEAGVVAMLTSSLDREDALKALKIAREHKGTVFLCVGFDPTIDDEEELEAVMQLARELAEKGEVVAIGEVGLDYYWVRSEEARSRQVARFKGWIRLAEELGLPLVVHSRSAGKYAIQALLDGETRNRSPHHTGAARCDARRIMIDIRRQSTARATRRFWTHEGEIVPAKSLQPLDGTNLVPPPRGQREAAGDQQHPHQSA